MNIEEFLKKNEKLLSIIAIIIVLIIIIILVTKQSPVVTTPPAPAKNTLTVIQKNGKQCNVVDKGVPGPPTGDVCLQSGDRPMSCCNFGT